MNREFSAGGAVFKNVDGKTLWLVTKAKPSDLFPRETWRLPKGWLDDINQGMSPGPLGSGKTKATPEEIQQAAIREVEEEGGVKVVIVTKLKTDTIFYTRNGDKVMKFITYFLMEWAEDLPQGFGMETEETTWLEFDEAHKKLTHTREKAILKKANESLETLKKQSSLV